MSETESDSDQPSLLQGTFSGIENWWEEELEAIVNR